MSSLSASRLLVIGMLFLITIPLSAKENKKSDTSLGVSAGMVSGYGFSLNVMPDRGLGTNVTLLLLKAGHFHYVNLGTEFLVVLNRSSSTAFYSLGGLSYHNTSEAKPGIAVGVGLGIAFGLGSKEYEDENRLWFSGDLVMTIFQNKLLPLPQFGAYYLVW